MSDNKYAQFNDQIIEEFRANGGTVSTAGFGRNLVLMHHVGAKSGVKRITPVMSIRMDADTWLVAASKAGADDNPAWYHNLVADPNISIEAPDDGLVNVHAEELKGDARDAAWSRFISASESFKQYEEQTSRTIPVIALRRS